ncbi:MAG: hypothetical protein JJE41_06080 [Candidatus Heimdallarchaeota archaeon]|nr:hypothetical protein [Candidatus Heimdallarchaeota archaeon]
MSPTGFFQLFLAYAPYLLNLRVGLISPELALFMVKELMHLSISSTFAEVFILLYFSATVCRF